ncbi:MULTISPECIES: ATP-binding protein [unclassified Rhizobium]|jgi:signal transduction histidine kinase|uniref:sensor histidine kinase n=1 Tax=unclassified Rhizobium TaxID=2613769 RepID=UPI0006488347|nr:MULTISPECIES: ATP-binding protein [unclassified Rhizobium]MBN8954255.1 GHKL domain-containing protein [Rhizobium tropici]OJY70856.1 MAG: two-component sensor histidine kinase [Rhizobium sp. 60-20]RKD50789.1 phospho-acceptor domain-containing protein [Rhizobium sp. WW_1]
MMRAPLLFRAHDPGGRYNAAFGFAAIALAIFVFYIDTYTDIEGAIAIFYVVSMLLAAQAMTRVGLLLAAIGCAFLTVLSYVMTHVSYAIAHGADVDLQSTIRLFGALAALIVTTMLLLKTETARLGLLSTNSALKKSEARYRSIFDCTRVALWERDYSKLYNYLSIIRIRGVTNIGAYAGSNPRFLDDCLGLIRVVAANEAASELLGSRSSAINVLRAAVHTERQTLIDMLQAIMDGKRIFEGNVRLRTDSGEEKLVLISINLPEDPAAFNRVVVSMVDNTQREMALKARVEAQAELTKAAKAATVGAMSASLAHELNQPLGANVVNAQTLLRWLDRKPPDLSAARRSAERMVRDSQRASEIIHNARSLLAPSTNKLEIVDIDELIEETIGLMEHELQRSRTEARFAHGAKLPPVSTVKIELQQVLINLITNAIQAMEEAGSRERIVTILSELEDCDHVSIVVRDTGPGIDPDAKDKLFSPFFTTKAKGMGMGLSICRSTLEARGGMLDGTNHPEGGAIFQIRLPMKPEMEHA